LKQVFLFPVAGLVLQQLIVYLSRTNNTKAVAQIIQKNVGGTMIALELEIPYPEHYQTTVANAKQPTLVLNINRHYFNN